MNKNLGILLPISALPSKSGIGEFGFSTYYMLSYMAKHHFHYWQILPLIPLGFGNSPYMSTCSKAIDYRYIALDELYEDGLLDELPPRYRVTASSINFEKVGEFKRKYLHIAFKNYSKTKMEGMKKFKFRQPWVQYYATFEAFKSLNNYRPWNEWSDDQKFYFDTHKTPPRNLMDLVDYYVFEQYIAFKQWHKVLSYANLKKVKIIADMPFYVGYDSLEVWLHKDQFMLDEETYLPKLVAGVPPDAFSATGQLWGNPIYNFEKMKENNYDLLVDRLGYLSKQCDYLRVDHFRAFDTYWIIPGNEDSAINGEWVIGPREDFFKCFYKKYPDAHLIAEDLGDLFPSVDELRDNVGLPGMFISQFHLLDDMDTSNRVVYTGTHDNMTLLGFVNSLNDEQITALAHKVKCRKNQLFNGIMEYTMHLPSVITIIPMQDLLRLDDKARMNTPGTCGAPNFMWKMRDFDMFDKIKVVNKGDKYYGKK